MSLPVRERGLKLIAGKSHKAAFASLPVRERGLKLERQSYKYDVSDVAPRAGAWIEASVKPAYPA